MHRRFNLVRTEDVSGLSGTGTVGEGCEFSDGTVVLRWRDAESEEVRARGVRPTTVLFESLDSVLALHGHNGATTIEMVDP